MKKKMTFFVVLCIMLAVSTASQASDVYDWRAKTEWICAQSFKMLERPILGYMVGGRPEHLVVEKVKDAVPGIQELGEIDAATAQIVVKSLVHSFFTDSELRLPIYTVRSIQKARINCSADIVRNDPVGGKAEAYQSVKAEEQRKKEEQDEIQAKEQEQKQQEEERAQLAEQKRQEEANKAKAAEEARIRQEEENAQQAEQRRVTEEEDARMQRDAEKRRAEVAERQKQKEAIIKSMLR